MRTLYRIEIPHYGPMREVAPNDFIYDLLGNYVYLVHADSVEEALNKLPSGTNKQAITKIQCEGPIHLIV